MLREEYLKFQSTRDLLENKIKMSNLVTLSQFPVEVINVWVFMMLVMVCTITFIITCGINMPEDVRLNICSTTYTVTTSARSNGRTPAANSKDIASVHTRL